MKIQQQEFLDLALGVLGHGAKIRFKVTGASMYPMLRDGDIAVLAACGTEELKFADIVLYRNDQAGVVLHRIVGIRKMGFNQFLLKGDYSSSPDGWIDAKDVLARLVCIDGPNGVRQVEGGFAHFLQLIFTFSLPLSRWAHLLFSKRVSRQEVQEVAYEEVVVNNKKIQDAVALIIKAFSDSGIAVMLLKGAFLVEYVYQDLGVRAMTDLDILIKRKDLSGANQILVSLGYRLPPHGLDLLQNAQTLSINSIMYEPASSIQPSVHLHWHIINSTWPLESLVCKIDMDYIWSQAQEFQFHSYKLLTFSLEHQIIYLTHHAFHHGFDKPARLQDIREVLRAYGSKLDDGKLQKEAERFGLSKILNYSLAVASGKIAPGNYWKSFLMYLSLQAGLWRKIRFLWWTIFPTRIILAHDLGLPVSAVTNGMYFSRLENFITCSSRH